ncbi:hypothetical protein RCL1_001894 [Eukaryota sp. TZLM3-RCL]
MSNWSFQNFVCLLDFNVDCAIIEAFIKNNLSLPAEDLALCPFFLLHKIPFFHNHQSNFLAHVMNLPHSYQISSNRFSCGTLLNRVRRSSSILSKFCCSKEEDNFAPLLSRNTYLCRPSIYSFFQRASLLNQHFLKSLQLTPQQVLLVFVPVITDNDQLVRTCNDASIKRNITAVLKTVKSWTVSHFVRRLDIFIDTLLEVLKDADIPLNSHFVVEIGVDKSIVDRLFVNSTDDFSKCFRSYFYTQIIILVNRYTFEEIIDASGYSLLKNIFTRLKQVNLGDSSVPNS